MQLLIPINFHYRSVSIGVIIAHISIIRISAVIRFRALLRKHRFTGFPKQCDALLIILPKGFFFTAILIIFVLGAGNIALLIIHACIIYFWEYNS